MFIEALTFKTMLDNTKKNCIYVHNDKLAYLKRKFGTSH